MDIRTLTVRLGRLPSVGIMAVGVDDRDGAGLTAKVVTAAGALNE